MTIQNGTTAFAGASGTTAATRMIWACVAAFAGAAVLAAPTTRGPFRHSMTFAGAGVVAVATDASVATTHVRVPPYLTAPPANRTDAASAAYGAGSFRAVTPSDTIALDPGCRGLYVAVGGTVTVKGIFDGTAVSLGTQAAGVIIPGRFGFVMSTGTAATVVALYS